MSDRMEYLHEVFEAFGPITSRRMFGGHGIYHEGLMFGLYAAGRLYLKTDAQNLPQFIAAQCEPFTIAQRGKTVKLSYWSAPDVIMDEPEQALFWGRSAFEAALRAQVAKHKNNKAPWSKTA